MALAAGRQVRAVWTNELGGRTFEISGADGRQFVKWAPPDSEFCLANEAARLRWAVNFAVVPWVLGNGSNEYGQWLLTAALPGECAISPRWKADPATAVAALGAGLRALHDALPVETCPFSWSVHTRLARAAEIPPELRDPPPVDRLVVCHGDPCSPNTLIDDSGNWSGHVDFEEMGVADRWADLAVATWAATWNYGPGWENALLEAYGIEPDPARTAYYRRLWETC